VNKWFVPLDVVDEVAFLSFFITFFVSQERKKKKKRKKRKKRRDQIVIFFEQDLNPFLSLTDGGVSPLESFMSF